MGNLITKRSDNEVNTTNVNGVYRKINTNFNNNSTNRSFISINSQQSNYSYNRPWSRISRKRWKESTLTLPYECSKTVWPVTQLESVFLPEFPIKSDLSNENFRIIEEINQGAFGKVYKVENFDTKRVYALKLLSKSKILTENCVNQVKDEVCIQKLCGHHPFIVNSPFQWQTRNKLFIITDFIEGGELFDLLKKYFILPLELVRLYVAQLALAIDFLHNAGIIYRDLKPENILLDKFGNCQLIDFGLSKWLSLKSNTKTICGTLRYMAPEILATESYGHAVDWWSLGVITCLMLTNKYPTAAIDPDPNPESKPGTLPSENNLDKSSKDLLLRLLEIDPKKRLKSLRTLETIAFFKGYNIQKVKEQLIRPFDLLNNYYQNEIPNSSTNIFENF